MIFQQQIRHLQTKDKEEVVFFLRLNIGIRISLPNLSQKKKTQGSLNKEVENYMEVKL